jgi:anti-sigma regulatory factor (Ser/Thr protein kinase)
MPYVNCPRCGLRTYTAGGGLWAEPCPSCGTRLRSSTGRYELRRHPPTVARRLDPRPHAPEVARRALDPLLGTIGEDALDRLQLLVTELVTNSIKHGSLEEGDQIGLDVYLDDGAVYAEVHDSGVGFTPRQPNMDPFRNSGWGLWLLDRLTTRWGIENSAGTTAWFEMPVAADAALS